MPKNKKRNTAHRGGSGGGSGGSGADAGTATTAGKGVSPPPVSRWPAGLARLFAGGTLGVVVLVLLELCVGLAPGRAGELRLPACPGGPHLARFGAGVRAELLGSGGGGGEGAVGPWARERVGVRVAWR